LVSRRAAPRLTRYVLVTAAHNEEAFLERTISSVVRQQLLPTLWLIVSDGSTDATDEIAKSYAKEHSFIQFLRIDRESGRHFVAKVNAVRAGFDVTSQLEYDFIGNLDADLSFDSDYFLRVLEAFDLDPMLGIAGGWICEKSARGFRPRGLNAEYSVPHAVQLLRRRCYEDIGDYVPLRFGGEDTYAVVAARMYGWRTRALPGLHVRHHRRSASLSESLKNSVRRGLLDYSLGYAVWYEALACLRRLVNPPYLAAAITQFAAFSLGYVRGLDRPVSDGFMRFLRADQRRRVTSAWRLPRATARQTRGG